MRRRRPGWRSVALSALLASPSLLLSSPAAGSGPDEDVPMTHVAGVGLGAPVGGARDGWSRPEPDRPAATPSRPS
jgi:hypothetical protein